MYTVKVVLHPSGDIAKACCGCPAGVDGRCNHLAATLFAIEDHWNNVPCDTDSELKDFHDQVKKVELATGKKLVSVSYYLTVFQRVTIGTLRSDNGDGNGNVRSLGRAGLRPVGVPAKIEITNFTSENVDDGH